MTISLDASESVLRVASAKSCSIDRETRCAARGDRILVATRFFVEKRESSRSAHEAASKTRVIERTHHAERNDHRDERRAHVGARQARLEGRRSCAAIDREAARRARRVDAAIAELGDAPIEKLIFEALRHCPR
jgi:hypothetical protein